MRKIRMEKGITLVALIITIIILLILAVVTIGSIKNKNIITYAQNTSKDYNYKKDQEESIVEGYETLIESNLPEEKEEGKEPISKETSYIGYYADVDGDGNIDGIIYADLAFDGAGKWIDDNGVYSYNKKESLNNYYVSQESYQYEKFAKKPVIAPIDQVKESDRFYVMALTDLNPESYYHWYYNAYIIKGQMKDYETDTSTLFGKGRENTNKMIGFWKGSKYGKGDAGTYKDIWGQISEKVSEGWFIPSRGEWGAFGTFTSGEEMTTSNWSEYGLSGSYWSSSQSYTLSAWYACFWNPRYS